MFQFVYCTYIGKCIYLCVKCSLYMHIYTGVCVYIIYGCKGIYSPGVCILYTGVSILCTGVGVYIIQVCVCVYIIYRCRGIKCVCVYFIQVCVYILSRCRSIVSRYTHVLQRLFQTGVVAPVPSHTPQCNQGDCCCMVTGCRLLPLAHIPQGRLPVG